mgnify:CR=1 FL=1
MTSRSWRWIVGLVPAVFIAGVILSMPFSSRAQQPAPPSTAPATAPTTPAPPPTASAPESDYVGAETCKGCHEEAYNKFAKTRMGRVFLFQARTPGEKNACENCHGPGKAHVEAGAARARAGSSPSPGTIPRRWKSATPCASSAIPRGPDLLEGERARVAQRGLYELSHADGQCVPEASTRQGQRDRDLRDLSSAEARADHAELAHAGARGEDDLLLVPQSARLGHASAAQGKLAERQLLHLPRGEAGPLPLEPSASTRELRELPRPARLEPRRHAQAGQAAALPAVSHRVRARVEAVRPHRTAAEIRDGTVVQRLPCGCPWLQSSGWLQADPLGGRPCDSRKQHASFLQRS